MKTMLSYIAELRNKYDFPSDFQACRYIGVSRSSLTKLRKGGSLSEKKCIRLAEALKIDPLEILATARAIRAENNELRDIWAKLATEKSEIV